MSLRPVIRNILLTVFILFLMVLAWWTLAGGLRQWPHSNTFGQQLETIVQIFCGLLSLLTAFTCFWWKKWAYHIRLTWAISFVATAGLSSLVWGPPMPIISLIFAGAALLLAGGVIWMMRTAEKT